MGYKVTTFCKNPGIISPDSPIRCPWPRPRRQAGSTWAVRMVYLLKTLIFDGQLLILDGWNPINNGINRLSTGDHDDDEY